VAGVGEGNRGEGNLATELLYYLLRNHKAQPDAVLVEGCCALDEAE